MKNEKSGGKKSSSVKRASHSEVIKMWINSFPGRDPPPRSPSLLFLDRDATPAGYGKHSPRGGRRRRGSDKYSREMLATGWKGKKNLCKYR